jgi:hypothetical protein
MFPKHLNSLLIRSTPSEHGSTAHQHARILLLLLRQTQCRLLRLFVSSTLRVLSQQLHCLHVRRASIAHICGREHSIGVAEGNLCTVLENGDWKAVLRGEGGGRGGEGKDMRVLALVEGRVKGCEFCIGISWRSRRMKGQTNRLLLRMGPLLYALWFEVRCYCCCTLCYTREYRTAKQRV